MKVCVAFIQYSDCHIGGWNNTLLESQHHPHYIVKGQEELRGTEEERERTIAARDQGYHTKEYHRWTLQTHTHNCSVIVRCHSLNHSSCSGPSHDRRSSGYFLRGWAGTLMIRVMLQRRTGIDRDRNEVVSVSSELTRESINQVGSRRGCLCRHCTWHSSTISLNENRENLVQISSCWRASPTYLW